MLVASLRARLAQADPRRSRRARVAALGRAWQAHAAVTALVDLPVAVVVLRRVARLRLRKDLADAGAVSGPLLVARLRAPFARAHALGAGSACVTARGGLGHAPATFARLVDLPVAIVVDGAVAGLGDRQHLPLAGPVAAAVGKAGHRARFAAPHVPRGFCTGVAGRFRACDARGGGGARIARVRVAGVRLTTRGDRQRKDAPRQRRRKNAHSNDSTRFPRARASLSRDASPRGPRRRGPRTTSSRPWRAPPRTRGAR